MAKCETYEMLEPHRRTIRGPLETGRYKHADGNVDVLRGTYNQLPYQLRRDDLMYIPPHVSRTFLFDFVFSGWN